MDSHKKMLDEMVKECTPEVYVKVIQGNEGMELLVTRHGYTFYWTCESKVLLGNSKPLNGIRVSLEEIDPDMVRMLVLSAKDKQLRGLQTGIWK